MVLKMVLRSVLIVAGAATAQLQHNHLETKVGALLREAPRHLRRAASKVSLHQEPHASQEWSNINVHPVKFGAGEVSNARNMKRKPIPRIDPTT